MANVVEGEASETDEEIFDDEPKQITRVKKVIHVDEKVQQCWKHLALDTQTVQWRRSQPAVKIVIEQKELAHRTFESVQAAAFSLRTASLNLLKIGDGLADIREACDLLPVKFINSSQTIN